MSIANEPDSNASFADQITFRDVAEPRDREAVRSLIERTGFFRPDEVAIAVELVDERLSRGEASGYHFMFAERGEAVAGYACYGEIACTIGSFDLFWIAVDPTFQRHGIGRMLMVEVESRVAAIGGRQIYIDTSGKPQYEPTRTFYERSGFRGEARLADFYSPGDDRLIYVKKIGSQEPSIENRNSGS
jgi:ribosomal protein S18 acetylase RimI-like enzyme